MTQKEEMIEELVNKVIRINREIRTLLGDQNMQIEGLFSLIKQDKKIKEKASNLEVGQEVRTEFGEDATVLVSNEEDDTCVLLIKGNRNPIKYPKSKITPTCCISPYTKYVIKKAYEQLINEEEEA